MIPITRSATEFTGDCNERRGGSNQALAHQCERGGDLVERASCRPVLRTDRGGGAYTCGQHRRARGPRFDPDLARRDRDRRPCGEALDRDLPAEVTAATKLHVLDTFAAILSGSRLKPGELAARYVDSLGGKPQAMVIGTSLLTSAVNAALANAMAAHADETDDTNPVGPFHAGCGTLAAALATGELAGRSGNDMLRG